MAAALLPPATVVTSAVVLSASVWCRKLATERREHERSSTRPRIDHANVEILKMSHIARGKIGAMSDDDAGDERIANLCRTSRLPTPSGDQTGRFRSIVVEWQNAAVKARIEDTGKTLFKFPTAAAHAEYFNPITQLEKGNRR